MRHAWSGLVLGLCAAACSPSTAWGSGAVEPPQPARDEGMSANYDDVIHDLIISLGRDVASAQDAAIKLGGLGKRSLPALNEVLAANYGKEKGNQQIVLYATIALARIKSSDAAKALLPILTNAKAPSELRSVALTAIGLENLDEAVAALQKMAAKDTDIELRRKAYNRLMTMPKQWQPLEKLFLEALDDPDAEVRAIAAKQCYFAAKIYRDAAPALIDAAQKEGVEAVRTQLFLALGRMQAKEAVPMLVRIYLDEATSPTMQKLSLNAVNMISGMDFKDKAALQHWWEKFGEKEYTRYEQIMKAMQKKAEADAPTAGGPGTSGGEGDAAATKPVDKK